ncbi:hypothetical protein HHK36_013926 [Tetracentron sinense]|uniref:UvrD-like helicase C-terminal domain-containing protein n=1 Tax=Tetracentron sinense TaxID=13715 RepID=A0A834ZE68_TETSI|nr:hypothetical protein HHK36_013926 [Tetracentron sinense]
MTGLGGPRVGWAEAERVQCELPHVGVYLPNPIFIHSQLYVAISRATSPNGLKILIVNKSDQLPDYTRNVVFGEVLHDIAIE